MGVRGGVSRPGAWWSWVVVLAWLDARARAGAGRTAVVVTRQVAEGGACGGQQQ